MRSQGSLRLSMKSPKTLCLWQSSSQASYISQPRMRELNEIPLFSGKNGKEFEAIFNHLICRNDQYILVVSISLPFTPFANCNCTLALPLSLSIGHYKLQHRTVPALGKLRPLPGYLSRSLDLYITLYTPRTPRFLTSLEGLNSTSKETCSKVSS